MEPKRENPEQEELAALARLLRGPTPGQPDSGDKASEPGPPPAAETQDADDSPPEATEPAGSSAPPELTEASPEKRRVAGRYVIVRPIGDDALGRVFRARDESRNGREVALRILRAESTAGTEFGRRFASFRERRTRLVHPALPELIDTGQTELGLLFLCETLAAGESLADLVQRRGPLPPSDAVPLVRAIASAVEAAHAEGLTDGGLDPTRAFVLRTDPLQVAVRDFGLPALLTREEVEEEEDVAALGNLLILLLTAKTPGKRPRWENLGLERNLKRLAQRALGASRERPLSSATALVRALDEYPGRRALAMEPRHWILAASLLALTFVVWWLSSRAENRRQEDAARFTTTLERLEGELQTERSAREAGALRLESELSKAEEATADLRRDVSSWTDRVDVVEGELAQQRAQSGERIATLERELEQARSRIENMAAEREGLPDDPAGAASDLLEELVAALEAGTPGRAMEAWNRAAARGLRAEVGERLFVDALLTGALAQEPPTNLEEGVEALDARARRLFTARVHLLEAQALRPAFVAANPLLLERGARSLTPALEHLVTGLAGVADREFEALRPEVEAAWSTLEEGPPEANPETVLALSRWRPRQDLEGYLERYARTVRKLVTDADGALLPMPSDAALLLEGWVRLLATDRELRALPAAQELFDLWEAAGWSESERAALELPWAELDPELRPEGWRRALALTRALLDPRAAFPGPTGGRRLEREEDAQGTVRWHLTEVRRLPREEHGWSLETRVFGAEGEVLASETLRVERIGRRFEVRGDGPAQIWLDLDSAPTQGEVEAWSAGRPIDPPTTLGISAAELTVFRERVAKQSFSCLRQTQGTQTTWWSPVLGPVRTRESDGTQRELMFLSAPAGGPR